MAKTVFRKFTFDNDFDRPKAATKVEASGASEPAAPPPPTYSEAELAAAVEAARKSALAEGIAKGRAEAMAQTERQSAAALSAIADRLSSIDRDVQSTAAKLSEIAIEVSLAMVRRLFPELTRRHGIGEIEGMLVHCLDTLKSEPRFAIRVPTDQLDELRGRVEQVAASRGHEGRVTILGDDGLKPGDCQVEWTQGGMIRTAAEILAAIDTAVEQALATIEDTPVATAPAVN